MSIFHGKSRQANSYVWMTMNKITETLKIKRNRERLPTEWQLHTCVCSDAIKIIVKEQKPKKGNKIT